MVVAHQRPGTHTSRSSLPALVRNHQDRKSTRLNSSHLGISYAVFCLKKKNKRTEIVLHKEKKLKEPQLCETSINNANRMSAMNEIETAQTSERDNDIQ